MKPDPNHPATDMDATFTATAPENTYAVMEALRKAGINFDVTVNGPKDDPNEQAFDIFWFNKEDDQALISRIVREALPEDAK
jgi:hypothetical protein